MSKIGQLGLVLAPVENDSVRGVWLPEKQGDMVDLYASFDVETRIVVQQRTSEIKTLMRRTAQDIVDIGHKLIEVKDRLGHGRFDEWLQVEFEWSLQTAKRFMNVARRFQNQQIVDFDMAPSALYLLAAPSVPDSACEEAMQRAETGERIGYHIAQGIVAAHREMSTSARQKPSARLSDSRNEEDRLPASQASAGTVQRDSPATQPWDTQKMAFDGRRNPI